MIENKTSEMWGLFREEISTELGQLEDQLLTYGDECEMQEKAEKIVGGVYFARKLTCEESKNLGLK